MSNQRRFALIGRGFGSDAFDEAVQDLIGALIVDSSEINFTYTDATPSISAALIDASIVFARLQNFDALSVLGRSANSAGVSDEIAAGANDRILRRTGDTLNFGQLTAGMFPNTVVPDAALSSNVPLLNAANVFTAIQSINASALTEPQLVVFSDYAIASQLSNITSATYGTTAGGTFHGNHARGTPASPTASLAGDVTGGIGSRAYHSGGAFQTSSPASIQWQATENQTSSAFGMWLRLLTTPKGSTTRAERGGLTDNGTMWIHDGATYDAFANAQTLPISDAAFVASGGGTKGAAFVAVSYDVTNFTAGFRGLGSRGTPASPSSPQANDLLCFLGGSGYDGSVFTGSKALLGLFAAETFSSTNQGTYVSIQTTPVGSTTRAERVRITDVELSFNGTAARLINTAGVSLPFAESPDLIVERSIKIIRTNAPNLIGISFGSTGSLTSPAACSNGDFLFQFRGRGYTGAAFSVDAGLLSLIANEAFSSTAQGTRWEVLTTPNGSTAAAAAAVASFASARNSMLTVLRLFGYTVATLPAGTIGDTAYVTDALAPAFGAAVVGGGAVMVPVYYTGAAWFVG